MSASSPLRWSGYEGGRHCHDASWLRPIRDTPSSSSHTITVTRYSDCPLPIATRLLGLGGTACICIMVLGAMLLRWVDDSHSHRATTSTLTVVEIVSSQAQSVPETSNEAAPAPLEQAVRAEPSEAPAPDPAPAPQSAPLVLVSTHPAAGPQKRKTSSTAVLPTNAAGGQPAPAAAASSPDVLPAPPAPKANDERAEWTDLVLAALHRAKRYPRAARRNRQEGTSWIRFMIDRRGRVRSASLQRSSGVEALDREALTLPERAQPLPRPPKAVTGNRIELVVPIEFFLR